jgi:Domain of unknown function (DUF4457)
MIESLKKGKSLVRDITQEYETIHMPRGFTIKIIIHSTWGDFDYVGLNGIQIYNHLGQPIFPQKRVKVSAEPL